MYDDGHNITWTGIYDRALNIVKGDSHETKWLGNGNKSIYPPKVYPYREITTDFA